MTIARKLITSITCSNYWAIALLSLGLLITPQLHANVKIDEKTLADQQLYKQTLTAIKKGHKTRIKLGMEELSDYPLYPYLQLAQITSKLKQLPYQKVDDFLAENGNNVLGNKLRHKWLHVLADKKQWAQFNSYYQAGTNNAELRCLHIEALHSTGYTQLALDKTTPIWLTGKSQPNACDTVFKRWQQAGYKNDNLVWQRTKLALESGNTLLARYLSKHASAHLKPYTRRLISVHKNPRRLTVTEDFNDGSIYSVDIISHGLKRLAPRDYSLATKLWVNYRGYIKFTDQQYFSIRDKISRQIIASGSEDALQWLIIHDPNSEDSYLLEWRIRLALKQNKWSQAENWIALLPDNLSNSSRWQYWKARALQAQHRDSEKVIALLEDLADQRHYYGFLAADLLRRNYGFNHKEMAVSQQLQMVLSDPAIKRAQQFYLMGELLSARREWHSVVVNFDQQQLTAATSIAHQWGWHQQAINTTIRAKQWNDLSIRFPLAYQNNILNTAKSVTIRPEWLYAITRQESAFGQDAYSPVGARGLMQLMPGTAKNVARKMGLNYSKSDLFKPEKNIALGSNYLKTLLDDFQGNHILATAAYNAGPQRVKSWLNKQNLALPHDIWIETLPFHETRNYIQNVLAFSVIYGHRLGIDTQLINEQEMIIGTHQQAPNL
jgi:soluble lytic murein transglycosylase